MIDCKGRRFEREIILICVCWYLAYPLSYRNLEEMMAERGVEVDQCQQSCHQGPFQPRPSGGSAVA
jgi:hypothetical protein